jgi:hypothetical protein
VTDKQQARATFEVFYLKRQPYADFNGGLSRYSWAIWWAAWQTARATAPQTGSEP